MADLPLDPRLMQALKFGEKELIANREGYLTPAQEKRILQSRPRTYLSAAILMGMALLIWLTMPLLIARQNLDSIWPISLICLIPVFVIIMVVIRLNNHRIQQDLQQGTVQCVTGQLTKRVHLMPTGKAFIPVPYLLIQQENFKVNHQVYAAFTDKAYYTVYFAPHTKILLSAEPVKTPEFNYKQDSY